MINLLISCNNLNENTFTEMFKLEQNVTLNELEFITPYLKSPDNFVIKGDLLFVSEPEIDTLLVGFDLKNKKMKNRFLRRGQGPNEAVSLQTFFLDDSLLYCNDIGKNRLNIFSSVSTDILEQKELSIPFASFLCDKDKFIFSLSGADKPFLVQKKNSQQGQLFGSILSVPNVSPSLITQVIQGPMALSPNEEKFVWFSVYGEIFQIYKNDETPFLMEEKIVKLPAFHQDGSMDMNNVLGVNSVTANNRFIYALYSGRTFKEAVKKGKDVFITDKILVFSWEGAPVKILNLDKMVKAIQYDKHNNILYCLGIDESGNYAIFKIDGSAI